jgi:hypothetical protein
LVPKHLNFHLLTRYAADFLEAVSNCFLKTGEVSCLFRSGFLRRARAASGFRGDTLAFVQCK